MAAATRLAVTLSRPSRTAIAAAASITSARRSAGAFRRAGAIGRAAGCGGRAAGWALDVTGPMILGDKPIELLVPSPTVVKMTQKDPRIRAHQGEIRALCISEGQRGPAGGGRLAVRLAPR